MTKENLPKEILEEADKIAFDLCKLESNGKELRVRVIDQRYVEEYKELILKAISQAQRETAEKISKEISETEKELVDSGNIEHHKGKTILNLAISICNNYIK